MSLQLKIKRDTKETVRKQRHANENNESGEDNDDGNLCDVLKNQWKKKK